MAINTEKIQEILSGAQAVVPRIRTETPMQEIGESVIDVKGGADPLEVPEIGSPKRKKKESLSQPSTGPSYSAVDAPLQNVDYGDPASFTNVDRLLAQGTSFVESPQRFTRTGTVSSAEGGDFFDDPADLDEFGAVGPDGRIDPDIIGDPFNYGSIEGFAKDVYNRPIGETFNQAIRDFGNFLEFGTTRPNIETVNSPVGLVATQITDPLGNITTPGFVSGVFTALGAPVGLAGRYGARALDYLTTEFAADFYTPGNVPTSYEQQQRSKFMSLAMAADPNIGTGWSTYGGKVAYATVDPNTANLSFADQYDIDSQDLDIKNTTYAAVDIDGYTYGVDIGLPGEKFDAKAGITAEQVRDYLEFGVLDDEFDVGVAQQIADAINNTNPAALLDEPLSEMVREIGAGFDVGPDPDNRGPETGLDREEIVSRIEDIQTFGPDDPTDNPAAFPLSELQRDEEATREFDFQKQEAFDDAAYGRGPTSDPTQAPEYSFTGDDTEALSEEEAKGADAAETADDEAAASTGGQSAEEDMGDI